MHKRPPLKLSFEYMDTPERRVVSLEPDGIWCLPVIGYDSYRTRWAEPPFHVHEECLEVTLCLRGELEFETKERTYPFRPGTVFVSGPKDLHRLKAYPKGLSKYWFLFRIPKKGFPLLSLPSDEAQTLIRALTHLPNRLFTGSDEVRRLFKKLFHQYDTLPKESSERSLRLRSTALALLLAVVDASRSSMRDRVEVRLQNFVDDMREHPEREYPLDQTAERLGLSPSNLLVRFKHLTGLPPHAFLLAQRIAKAKEMLTASMPIATIAHKLGFATSQHLSNQFKASTGLSPSEWKRANRPGAMCKKSLK